MAYSGAFQKDTGPESSPAEPVPPKERPAPPPRSGGALPFDLGALFRKAEVAGMETDDLLMALVLYLMYRESGDIDLLIMLGVMLLT